MCAYDGTTDRIKLRQCLKEIGQHIGAKDAELSFLKKATTSKKMELAEFLLNKACAYEDMDFYCEAVRLVDQREVTCLKLQMDLPLWDEDKGTLRNF